MDQHRRSVRSQEFTQVAINFRFVFIRGDEIGNDFNPLESKMFDRRLFQVIRDRGNAV